MFIDLFRWWYATGDRNTVILLSVIISFIPFLVSILISIFYAGYQFVQDKNIIPPEWITGPAGGTYSEFIGTFLVIGAFLIIPVLTLLPVIIVISLPTVLIMGVLLFLRCKSRGSKTTECTEKPNDTKF